MIDFKFSKATISAPSEWKDVTVEMFSHPYFLTRDAVGILSVLTGIEKHVLMNTKEDLEGPLTRMVTFLGENPEGYKNYKIKPIKVNGITCKIPKDIELERLGQKIMLSAVMMKNKYVYEGIAEAVAIYLVPELNNGEFDDSMIEEVTEQVGKLKIIDVWPVADFFLDSYRASRKSGPRS